MQYWQIRDRKLPLEKTLVMGVLNVTPDSFSDGGKYLSPDDALRHAEQLIEEGADILDIGGESTRPGSRTRIEPAEEIKRVTPVIEAVATRFDTPISIDTAKSEVAKKAIDSGAAIINDISGLRFDGRIADLAASSGAGLVLMHSRGTFETLHSQEPVADIISEIKADLTRAVDLALSRGVKKTQLALDVGIGFGKTLAQNLELIAKLDKLKVEFHEFPFLIGASRKSFIGKLLGDVPPGDRLDASVTAAGLAAWNGANIVRVHDVKETIQSLALVQAVRKQL